MPTATGAESSVSPRRSTHSRRCSSETTIRIGSVDPRRASLLTELLPCGPSVRRAVACACAVPAGRAATTARQANTRERSGNIGVGMRYGVSAHDRFGAGGAQSGDAARAGAIPVPLARGTASLRRDERRPGVWTRGADPQTAEWSEGVVNQQVVDASTIGMTRASQMCGPMSVPFTTRGRSDG